MRVDLAPGKVYFVYVSLGSERGEMCGGEIAVLILDKMQMLYQQIAPTRPVGEQRAHFHYRLRVDLTSFRRTRWTSPPARGP